MQANEANKKNDWMEMFVIFRLVCVCMCVRVCMCLCEICFVL